MALIERLQKIALSLRPLQPWFLVLTGLFLLLFFFVLMTMPAGSGNQYILPILISMIWSLSAFSFIQVFSAIDISRDEKNAAWWKKLQHRTRRLFHLLIVLVFLVTTLTGVVMTWRLIHIWLRDYS